MRTNRSLLARVVTVVVVASAAAAGTAIAGDCESGFTCENVCPLAKQVNTMRATGREALASAPSLRGPVVAAVERNLARI